LLHQHLVEEVMTQDYVLLDTALLCGILQKLCLDPLSDVGLLSADVTALYPSIQPEKGLQ
jgi:hypothetical protein